MDRTREQLYAGGGDESGSVDSKPDCKVFLGFPPSRICFENEKNSKILFFPIAVSKNLFFSHF